MGGVRPIRPARYTTTWRFKGLGDGSKSIGEMSAQLRKAADILDKMSAKGVVLELDGGEDDDYFTLATSSKDVAQEFGMGEEET